MGNFQIRKANLWKLKFYYFERFFYHLYMHHLSPSKPSKINIHWTRKLFRWTAVIFRQMVSCMTRVYSRRFLGATITPGLVPWISKKYFKMVENGICLCGASKQSVLFFQKNVSQKCTHTPQSLKQALLTQREEHLFCLFSSPELHFIF